MQLAVMVFITVFCRAAMLCSMLNPNDITMAMLSSLGMGLLAGTDDIFFGLNGVAKSGDGEE